MSDSVKAEWIGRELGVDVSPPVELDDTVPILQIWRDAKEAVDVNLSRLQTALRLSETDLGATVADVGLAPFTRGLQVKLVAALMDYEHSAAAPATARPPLPGSAPPPLHCAKNCRASASSACSTAIRSACRSRSAPR
ncbi:MAG: hypothetical protein WDN04_04855 [Rhodospirillales bacterium]